MCPTVKRRHDYKKFPLCRSRFLTKQIATSTSDDVTQSIPAQMVLTRVVRFLGAGMLRSAHGTAEVDASSGIVMSILT